MKPKPIDLSPTIPKRLKGESLVLHKGRMYAVATINTQQLARTDILTGKSGSFTKPEITVYRIHCGKILRSSSSYIGLNYTVAGKPVVEAMGLVYE